MSLGELWHQITSALSEGVLPDLGAWSYVILVLLVFVEIGMNDSNVMLSTCLRQYYTRLDNDLQI